MKKKIERLGKLEEAYSFVDGLEKITRESIIDWPTSIMQWELLTWCVIRKRAIETEGDDIVKSINSRTFYEL